MKLSYDQGPVATLVQQYGTWVRAHPLGFVGLATAWACFYWIVFRFEKDIGAAIVSALAALTTVTAPWGLGGIIRSCSGLLPPRRLNVWWIAVALLWIVLFFLVAELVGDLRSMPKRLR